MKRENTYTVAATTRIEASDPEQAIRLMEHVLGFVKVTIAGKTVEWDIKIIEEETP